ncbi:MAG: hypothetical protein OXG39_01475 [Chloroflexi bacterium]|nr:hypothetical protein [Chloroflexota bacterium]
MQASGDHQPGNPYQPGQITNHEGNRASRQGRGCLLWAMVVFVCIMAAALTALAFAYAGWHSGIAVARENATATGEAETREQCERIRADMDAGNQQLLQTRLAYLLMMTPAPSCLSEIIPSATALYQQSQPTAIPQPTEPVQPVATLPSQAATAAATIDNGPVYDLEALLLEAQADIVSQAYQRAVDTLDAIIAVDESFQRDRVRELLFAALTSQATGLFRSGRLSEAILTTGRAENYGDVEGLNYERAVAELYLRGLQLKIANPGEAVRLLSVIVYEHRLGNYLNGQIMTELQGAHQNYGDALAFRGDHCRARDQYEAALALQPAVTAIGRATVRDKRDKSNALCPAPNQTDSSGQTGTTAGNESARAGVGVRPSPAPVGQTG